MGMTKYFFKEDAKRLTIASVPNYGVKCGHGMGHRVCIIYHDLPRCFVA